MGDGAVHLLGNRAARRRPSRSSRDRTARRRLRCGTGWPCAITTYLPRRRGRTRVNPLARQAAPGAGRRARHRQGHRQSHRQSHRQGRRQGVRRRPRSARSARDRDQTAIGAVRINRSSLPIGHLLRGDGAARDQRIALPLHRRAGRRTGRRSGRRSGRRTGRRAGRARRARLRAPKRGRRRVATSPIRRQTNSSRMPMPVRTYEHVERRPTVGEVHVVRGGDHHHQVGRRGTAPSAPDTSQFGK